MSSYTPATNFGLKDALISGNPAKALKGVELTNEFVAIAVSVNSKQNAQSLDVTSYGADISGGTDSSAAINAAVAAGIALGGARILYPAGTYLVGATPISYVAGGIFHEGASTESTVIVNSSTNTPAFSVGDGITQVYGGGISAMRFTTKAGVVAVAGQTAFSFNLVGQFRIKDVFISNALAAPYRGASFTNCSQFVLNNLQVQGCLFDGITNIGGVDCYATDCRSDANTGAGFVLNASQGGVYKSCTAFNNTKPGWILVSGSPASAPNKNNSFMQCVGDTSGTYNWQISDSQDSQWVDCWGGTQQSIVVNTFAAGFFVSTQYCKRLGFNGCIALNNNAQGFQLFDPGSSAPTAISLHNCYGTGNGVAAGGGYGLSFNGVTNQIRVNGGNYAGNATGSILNQSSSTDITVAGNPIGFASTTQGVGLITTTNTSVAITHGLGFTPNAANIQLTDTTSRTASGINSVWISAPGATTFTVNVNTAVAGANFGFVWRASFNGT